MKHPKFRAALGSEIIAVIENLQMNANGFFLSAEQMDACEQLAANAETANGEVTRVTKELGTATAEVTRLTTDLQAAGGQLTKSNSDLIAANARIAELEKMVPGIKNTITTKDPVAGAKNPDKYNTSFDAMLVN